MFLSNDELEVLLSDNECVTPFNRKRIKSGAYELTLGKEYFTTNAETNVKTVIKDEKQFTIEPGQFALLITEEYIKIPADKLGFISIKAKIKFEGLINVSGFHVDPGFEGKLKFSVYNAGSKPITLDVSEPLFPLWITEFNKPLRPEQVYRGEHKNQDTISRDDVSKIAGAVVSPAVLDKKINKVDNDLDKRIISLDNKLDSRAAGLDANIRNTDNIARGIGILLVSVLLSILGLEFKSYIDRPDKDFQKDTETKQQEIDVRLAKQDSIIAIQKAAIAKHDSILKRVQANGHVAENNINSGTR